MFGVLETWRKIKTVSVFTKKNTPLSTNNLCRPYYCILEMTQPSYDQDKLNSFISKYTYRDLLSTYLYLLPFSCTKIYMTKPFIILLKPNNNWTRVGWCMLHFLHFTLAGDISFIILSEQSTQFWLELSICWIVLSLLTVQTIKMRRCTQKHRKLDFTKIYTFVQKSV